jgi:hypothetical protein
MEHVWRDRLDSREAIAEMVNNAPTVRNAIWISVKDRLPDEGENVLTYGARPFYDVFYVNRLIDKKNGEWLYDGVTHWMPLPQKPESEDDAE